MGSRQKLDKSPAKGKASKTGGVKKSRVVKKATALKNKKGVQKLLKGVKKVIKKKRPVMKLEPAVMNGISELKKIMKSGVVNRDDEGEENESASVFKAGVNRAKNIAGKVTQKFRSNGSGKRVKKVDPVKLNRGVVLLSHLPHGFFENEITAYFSQFGVITGVHLPRSKTGRIKGYAFIEFQHPEVAQVAAETMDNYLMLQRLLKAKYIPPEEQKPHLFQQRPSLKDKIDRLKIHRVENENRESTARSFRKKLKKLRNLAEMKNFAKDGIKYDIEIVSDKNALLTGIKQIDSET